MNVAAAVSLAVSLPMPQAPVTVRVPEALPAAVGERLAEWGGTGWVVAVGDAGDLGPATPEVLLLWDEWTLARAAAAGGEIVALPFADRVVVAADAALLAAGEFEPTWESIALAPALHDRLGLPHAPLCGPAWPAAPRAPAGPGAAAAPRLALWAPPRARAGRACGSVAQLREGLLAGRYAAAIGPDGWFADLPTRAAGALRRMPLAGSPIRRGIAVTAGADTRTYAVATALLASEWQRDLAAAGGFGLLPPAAPSLEPAAARRWWGRYVGEVRARGRAVEELADWLDLAFGIGFLVAAFLLYRALRKAPV